MKVYNLAGKEVIVHENKLFVEADGLRGVEISEVEDEMPKKNYAKPLVRRSYTKRTVEKPSKPVVARTSKTKRLGQEAKEALIKELEAGDKTIAELAEEYEMTVAGIHYIRKRAGIENVRTKPKDSDDSEEEEDNGGEFIKKNFQCDCGKGFSARTTGKPGEMVSCPDPECGYEMLASDGEVI